MSKECNTNKVDILALIDGEIKRSESKQLSFHMTKCKKCRAEYESLKEICNLYKQAEAIRFSPQFWPKLQERLDRVDQERSVKGARALPAAQIQVFQQRIGEKIVELLKIPRLTPGFVLEVLRPIGLAVPVSVPRRKRTGVEAKGVPSRKELRFRVAPNTFVEVSVDKNPDAPFRVLAKVVKEDRPLGGALITLRSTKFSHEEVTVSGTGCAFFPAVECGRYKAVVTPPPEWRGAGAKWKFELVLSKSKERFSKGQAIAKKGKT